MINLHVVGCNVNKNNTLTYYYTHTCRFAVPCKKNVKLTISFESQLIFSTTMYMYSNLVFMILLDIAM